MGPFNPITHRPSYSERVCLSKFASFDKIFCFYLSRETSLNELLQDAIYFRSFYKNEFGVFASRFCFGYIRKLGTASKTIKAVHEVRNTITKNALSGKRA